MVNGGGITALVKKSVTDFIEDDCPRMAAALAYYTVFSLPPLLVLLLMLVGLVWDPATLQTALQGEFAQMVGPTAAEGVSSILENANRPGSGGVVGTVLGGVALVFGATGAFAQLQAALNRAWQVEPDPAQGGIKNFLIKRVLSFGMILGIAFLLLVSLVASAVLSGFGAALAEMLPGGLTGVALEMINLGISLLAVTLLFAAIYRIVPDAKIAWRDVWTGAAVTATLFVAGKSAIGLYLGRSDPGQAYGAASSLAVLLLWIYLSGLLVLLGAEFTQGWAEAHGKGIEPEEGAVRVVQEKRHLRGSGRTDAAAGYGVGSGGGPA